MGTILTIAESFANESFDISSDIRTIEAFGYECVPLAVNVCSRLEVASAMNELFSSGEDLPQAVKIGFLTSAEVVMGVAERLKRYKVANIVVDPAIISEDGQILITEDVFVNLSNKLFPLAAILTPNPYEIELMAGMEVHSEEDLIKASSSLSMRYRCAIYVKAFESFGVDLLVGGEEYCWLPRGESQKADEYNIASAIACQLPDCESLEQVAMTASQFVYGIAGEEKEQKAEIPFSKTPKAEEPKAQEPAPAPVQEPAPTPGVEEAPKYEIKSLLDRKKEISENPSEGGVKSLKTVSADGHSQISVSSSESAATKPVSKKGLEVVVDVDNFAPEPVIDESLSKSLRELRAKLDKLK